MHVTIEMTHYNVLEPMEILSNSVVMLMISFTGQLILDMFLTKMVYSCHCQEECGPECEPFDSSSQTPVIRSSSIVTY